MCCLISDKSGSNREDSYTVSFAELVNPLAKRLDIVEQDIKHCVFVNVAVEILIAALVCHESLVVQRRNLKLLNRRRLDRVTSCRNKEHCVCEIRWIIVAVKATLKGRIPSR
jgi:hypothetical protein